MLNNFKSKVVVMDLRSSRESWLKPLLLDLRSSRETWLKPSPSRLAKFKRELITPKSGGAAAGEGFDVAKTGDARIGFVGFPSVSSFVKYLCCYVVIRLLLRCYPSVFRLLSVRCFILTFPSFFRDKPSHCALLQLAYKFHPSYRQSHIALSIQLGGLTH